MKMEFAQVINKGMQRDYAMNTASQEFAYENKNIRITTTGDESFLAVTNEKSTVYNAVLMAHLQTYDVRVDYKYHTDNIHVEELTITFNFYDGTAEKEEPLKKDTTFRIYDNYEGSKEYREIVIPKGVTTFTITDWDIQDLHFDKGVEIVQIDNKELYNIANDVPINIGTVLGATTIGEYVVVFSKYEDTNEDTIYRLKEFDADVWLAETVFRGDLKFNLNYPIECTASYESDDVQKVYWVDGINQPRVINICELGQSNYTTNLDFVPKIDTLPIVTVKKQYEGAGVFPSGVIQYYITYYNKFGQESNAVYTSPLHMISSERYGGNEDETQDCSFELLISNVDIKYDYIRVYSFIRTSINGIPSASVVGDINIQKDKKEYVYRIVDTNVNNIPVAASDILFLGGNTIVASTIEQKDNTLFLGNITTKSNEDDYTELKQQLEIERNSNTNSLNFFNRPVEIAKYSNTDYGYAPNMSATSKSKGFKYLEWYRFGLQFQNETGEWGSVVWIGDKQNLECYPNQINNNLSYYDTIQYDSTINDIYSKFENEDYNNISAIRYTPTSEIKSILSTFKNATKYRLVMAEHNNQTRTIKTQGFVMPTVFNLQQRSSESCFGSPIWSYGALNNKQHLHNVDFSKYEDTESFKVNPTQQLDSALYKNISDKDSGGNITNLKFSYLPTATVGTKTDSSSDAYLQKIDVIITVVRSTYDHILSYADSNNEFKGLNVTNFERDKGGTITAPSLIQDFFQIRIIPYKCKYERNEVIKMKEFTISDYRLAGKRKNTFIYLLGEIVSKTWDDYGSYTKEGLVDYMSGQLVNSKELPTADDLRDASGASADYTTSKELLKHGSAVDKDLNTISEHSNEYFIDANLCNLWTPDIDNLTNGNYNIRLIGSVETLNTISDYDITVENNVIESTTYTQADFNFNQFKWGQSLTDENNRYNIGVSSFLLWPGISHLMWVYPWNQQDYIQGENFKLKSKTFGNFWKCNTEYVDYKNLIDYNKIRVYKSEEDITNMDLNLYYGKYQNLLFPLTNQRVFLNNESIVKDSAFEEIVFEIKKNNNSLVNIEEGSVGTRGTVNMKYSSTPHMVFKLPISGGYSDVLPQYEQSNSEFIDKDATVWDSTIYPINSIIVDGYFKATVANGTGDVLRVLKEKIKENNKFKAIILENGGLSYLQLTTDNLTITLDFWSCKNDGNVQSTNVTTIPSKAPIIFYEELGSININRITFPALMLNDNGDVTFEDVDNSYIFTNLNDYTSIKYTKSTYETYNFWNSKTSKTTKEKTYYSDLLHRSRAKANSFIAELYTEYDSATFMGGTTENALELNTFIPISDPTPIGNTIYGFEGDTYYQQWDCLRIYPTSEEDVNKIVDVVSVPIETYTNLDGDTRKARGRADVINIRPDNIMNQINPVYSQSNNYITSNILDKKFEDSTHPLQYWWSLTKVPNSDIDTWTGVNLTSVAELDGDKGPLNKIKRWNNQLYAFQDKAIAIINYNNQTTIATQEGLPVEISNSGKVNGHYYITTNNGCKNKWSIVESPNGLYFIDSYNKSINVIGDGIKSLSQLNLFQDWIEQKERGNIWTPIRDIQAFKGFYDPIHKEVYFADGEDCICYNELLQQFTSFYDYQNMNYMFTLDNHVYSIPTDGNLYTMFEGDYYCNLFGKQCEYYIQYKVNKDPFVDKTWTNLEYRADIFNEGNIQSNEDYATDRILSDKTFDSLKVWNEYQSGELDLTKTKFNYLKDAKSRFRVWRTNIPRANKSETNKYGLDRIRNPWIMLELKKNADDSNKRMEFHDLVVKYVI